MNVDLTSIIKIIDPSCINLPKNKELGKEYFSIQAEPTTEIHYTSRYKNKKYISFSSTHISNFDFINFKDMKKLEELTIVRNPYLKVLNSKTIHQLNSNKTIKLITIDKTLYKNSKKLHKKNKLFRKSIKINLVD